MRKVQNYMHQNSHRDQTKFGFNSLSFHNLYFLIFSYNEHAFLSLKKSVEDIYSQMYFLKSKDIPAGRTPAKCSNPQVGNEGSAPPSTWTENDPPLLLCTPHFLPAFGALWFIKQGVETRTLLSFQEGAS